MYVLAQSLLFLYPLEHQHGVLACFSTWHNAMYIHPFTQDDSKTLLGLSAVDLETATDRKFERWRKLIDWLQTFVFDSIDRKKPMESPMFHKKLRDADEGALLQEEISEMEQQAQDRHRHAVRLLVDGLLENLMMLIAIACYPEDNKHNVQSFDSIFNLCLSGMSTLVKKYPIDEFISSLVIKLIEEARQEFDDQTHLDPEEDGGGGKIFMSRQAVTDLFVQQIEANHSTRKAGSSAGGGGQGQGQGQGTAEASLSVRKPLGFLHADLDLRELAKIKSVLDYDGVRSPFSALRLPPPTSLLSPHAPENRRLAGVSSGRAEARQAGKDGGRIQSLKGQGAILLALKREQKKARKKLLRSRMQTSIQDQYEKMAADQFAQRARRNHRRSRSHRQALLRGSEVRRRELYAKHVLDNRAYSNDPFRIWEAANHTELRALLAKAGLFFRQTGWTTFPYDEHFTDTICKDVVRLIHW